MWWYDHFEQFMYINMSFCQLLLAKLENAYIWLRTFCFVTRWGRCGTNSSQSSAVSSVVITDWNVPSETWKTQKWKGGNTAADEDHKLEKNFKKLRMHNLSSSYYTVYIPLNKRIVNVNGFSTSRLISGVWSSTM